MQHTPEILGEQVRAQLDRVRTLLEQAVDVARLAQLDTETGLLTARLGQVEKAALFVIIGEVKAGKSTFINAFLGYPVCEVAPDPCTATIQEITWGDETGVAPLGNLHEQVTVPAEVLKHITVVDTPGTNSVISQHQVITESYVPQADLVVFVLAAKNPHTKSAWDFLDFVNEQFRQKIVFVLQQADLATEQELQVSITKVQQYARERGIVSPRIFPVSAINELKGVSPSGFAAFRGFVTDAVEHGEIWQTKIQASGNAVRSSMTRILEEAELRAKEIAHAEEVFGTIRGRIERRRALIADRRQVLSQQIEKIYDRCLAGLRLKIEAGLSIGQVLSRAVPFVGQSTEDWLRGVKADFEKEALPEIQRGLSSATEDYVSELEMMIEEIRLELERNIRDIRDGQSTRQAALVFEKLLRRTDAIASQEDFLGTFTHGPNVEMLVGGAGLAALGALIAGIASTLIFDITGGILATLGGLLIAFAIIYKRPRIMKELDQKIAAGRTSLIGRFTDALDAVESRVISDLETAISDMFGNLKRDRERLKGLTEAASTVRRSVDS